LKNEEGLRMSGCDDYQICKWGNWTNLKIKELRNKGGVGLANLMISRLGRQEAVDKLA
jgi:hypothetical protein